ncbi:thymidylate synthase [Bacillus haynesii]|uniref:thymidylate synthase n=1 Tax=Bacillus haynesii TaxID=1925021 RepID=UPI002281A48B|nr:thymidylate synthase [Bacillus haynesii]MCY7753580.1 thymidylate synthase [Bacillus haynesii]MCY7769599.1 thymidylate synthase [Bacillus haynesii]MCY7850173.1 thymidylate synthase [Bacillus haynesii]MCY7863029.1 thymidylate synthase [Bacillus haynesii]MCY7912254.1 thymidylate synthase [Bacillus haynesii]
MSHYDQQYNAIIQKIIESGISDEEYQVRTKWDSDATPAHTLSIMSEKMRFDNSEVPILTTKKVAWKTAIKELLWIWQLKSNDVQVLNDMGVHIWDQWRLEDGTIGAAYGYQLGKKNRTVNGQKVDQVDYLLHQLKHNPSSRRHLTMLWNPDDLDGMALTPCVYETQWYVKEGKLSLEVRARSNDMALGNPFNVFQYNVLQRMIAQVLGYELGEYIFNIGDCHIYTRHIDNLNIQMKREQYEAPKLWINPDIKNFYDFTIDDFKLIDYKHGDKLTFEVAV